MVKAVAVYDEGGVKSLEISGHAGYGAKGQDIVCAAVSAVSQGGLNALEHPENHLVEVRPGHFRFVRKEALTTHDQTVLEVIIVQIESIAISYPEYAVLERKKHNVPKTH